ncbi:hypothetical protein C2E23DRAFT_735124 [Lenzites betulinus]|nr:hypothetical protein C2E23DRAFT_735124 [Lenzites betulinus]
MGFDASIGSIFIGYAVSLWLYGITLSQIVLFFHNNSRTSVRHLRVVVWLLFILENAQTIVISEGVWLYLVSYHLDPQRLERPTRYVASSSMNNLLVRSVYAFRIYKRKSLLPWSHAVPNILSSYLSSVRMQLWDTGRNLSWIFYSGYACELAADCMITVSMVYTLIRTNVGMRRTEYFTQTLLIYFLNSGLLVMLCVVCSIIAYRELPHTYAFFAFYLALGKLYANSLLGTLNARDVIFPHATWRSTRTGPRDTRAGPLLTSVVVLDERDMVATVVPPPNSGQQRERERDAEGGSFDSDATRVVDGVGKESMKSGLETGARLGEAEGAVEVVVVVGSVGSASVGSDDGVCLLDFGFSSFGKIMC